MSIQMPEEFDDCDDNVIEFLDGGDAKETCAIVFGGLSEAITGIAMFVCPIKFGWFGMGENTAAAAKPAMIEMQNLH